HLEHASLTISGSVQIGEEAAGRVQVFMDGEYAAGGEIDEGVFGLPVTLPVVDGFTPVTLSVFALDEVGRVSEAVAIDVNVVDDTVSPVLAEIFGSSHSGRTLAGGNLSLRV